MLKTKSMKKVCFIIGASSGIGESCAQKFLSEGYVVYNGSRNPSTVDGVKNLTLDVATESTIDEAISIIEEEQGGLDVLVYSAGYSMMAPVEYAKQSDYRYLMEVNFFGFVLTVQKAMPLLVRRHGRIIALSSIGAVVPIGFDAFYSASKAALNMFIRELNIEIAKKGVKAIAVMPGGTKTSFTRDRNVYSEEEAKEYSEYVKNASKALGEIEQKGMSPEEVAETVYRAATGKTPEIISAGAVNKTIHALSRIMPTLETRMISKLIFRV